MDSSKKQDSELIKIEGIGPKIAMILTNSGYGDFHNLAKARPEELKAVLIAAGSRFNSHDPSSWPHQARLAKDEQWEELKILQDELLGGKVGN